MGCFGPHCGANLLIMRRMPRRNRPRSGANRNLVGPQIRKLRLSMDKSLVDLAADLEMNFGLKLDRSVIGKIEVGKRRVFDIELPAFADALEVRIEELFPETPMAAQKRSR